MQSKKLPKKKYFSFRIWLVVIVIIGAGMGLYHYFHIFNLHGTDIKISDPYIPLTDILKDADILKEIDAVKVVNDNKQVAKVSVIKKQEKVEIKSSKQKQAHPSSSRKASIPLLDKKFLADKLNPCNENIVNLLNSPILSPENRSFCVWALDPQGGGLVVGKSWGKLTKKEQKIYEHLNCNFVMTGLNPSCDDTWGDGFVRKWRKQITPDPCQSNKQSPTTGSSLRQGLSTGALNGAPVSSIHCHVSSNDEKFCTMTHAAIDFSKMKDVTGGHVDSRSFEKGFLSVNCPVNSPESEISFKKKYFPFPEFLSFDPATRCDVRVNGTTLLYSHDEIRNFCHTLQDIMNVWMLLWLLTSSSSSSSSLSKDMGKNNADIMNFGRMQPSDVTFLTVDALRLYNNFHDKMSPFYEMYQRNFKQFLPGVEFGSKTVCFDELILQALPPKGFVWDSWDADVPCSVKGPSTLFQRFNIHARNTFGLLSSGHLPKTYERLQVLLIIRSESANPWGDMRTSRLLNNPDEIYAAITTALEDANKYLQQLGRKPILYTVVRQDLAALSISEQMSLVSDTSIITGMHGAGIANVVNLPIGSPFCCGILEAFPKGEFTPARGYGNMARRLNVHYDRMDLTPADSGSQGSTIPALEFGRRLKAMILKIVDVPTCVLPAVIEDPYFVNV